MPPTSEVDEMKAESPTPDTEEKSDIQLEPTQDEMERERLTSKAEQVNTDLTWYRRIFGPPACYLIIHVYM